MVVRKEDDWFLWLPVHRFCWASSLDSWAATIFCTSRYKRERRCHYFHQRGFRCPQTPGGCYRAKQLQKNSNTKFDFHTWGFFLFVWLGFFWGGGGMKYQQCVNTSKMFRSTKYTMLHLTLMPALWACSPLFGSAASSLLQNDTSIAPWKVDSLHFLSLLTHRSQGCTHQTHTG